MTPSLVLAELEASLKHNAQIDKAIKHLKDDREQVEYLAAKIVQIRDQIDTREAWIAQWEAFLSDKHPIPEERIEELRGIVASAKMDSLYFKQ